MDLEISAIVYNINQAAQAEFTGCRISALYYYRIAKKQVEDAMAGFAPDLTGIYYLVADKCKKLSREENSCQG